MSEENDDGWKSEAVDATEKLRSKLEAEERESSGTKASALKEAREYVEKAEEKLKDS